MLNKQIHDYIYKLIVEKYPEETNVLIPECDWEEDIKNAATYFYNQALTTVKKEVENMNKEAKELYGYSQFNSAYKHVIEMLESKLKEIDTCAYQKQF